MRTIGQFIAAPETEHRRAYIYLGNNIIIFAYTFDGRVATHRIGNNWVDV